MAQDITALEELKISQEVKAQYNLGLNLLRDIQGVGKVQSKTESGVRSWVSKRLATKQKPEDGDSVSTKLVPALQVLFSPL